MNKNKKLRSTEGHMKRTRAGEEVVDKYADWFNAELDDDEPVFLNIDQQETNTSRHYIAGDEPVMVEYHIDMNTNLRGDDDDDDNVVEMLRLYEEQQREDQEQEPEPDIGFQNDLDDFYGEEDDTSDDEANDARPRAPPTLLGNMTNQSAYERPIAPDIDTQHHDFVFQHTETTYGIDEVRQIPELRIWGVDADGHSVLLRDCRAKPYFFAHISNDKEADEVRINLEKYLRLKYNGKRGGNVPDGKFILHVERISGRSICGWHRNLPLQVMYKFTMAHPAHVAAARDCLEFCNRAVTQRAYKTYEANVPFELRCMIDSKINGCEWIRIKAGGYKRIQNNQLSTVQYEFVTLGGEEQCIEPIPAATKGDLAPMRYLSYDIEVLNSGKGFPTADKSPVILIAAALNVTGKGIVHQVVFAIAPSADEVRVRGQLPPGFDTIDGATVLVFATEQEMILAFSQYVQACDPEALTGWNTSDFDLPYLAERAKQLGCFKEFMSFSRLNGKQVWIRQKTFQSKAYGAKVSNEMLCEGRFDYDGLTFMLRGQMEKYRSYKLNYISKKVLDDQKVDVDYSQIPILYHGTNSDRTRLAFYCLSEDSQILTNKGFMFLDQLLKEDQKELLICGYDPNTKKYVYEHASNVIVNDNRDQEMIEFTHSYEAHRWGEGSDPFGRNMDDRQDGYSNSISLVTTPDHDMYARMGRYSRGNIGKADCFRKSNALKGEFRKIKAESLLSNDTKDAVQFLAFAEDGVCGGDDPLPFVDALKLETEDQINAFLAFYGYWLGDGHLRFASDFRASVDSVCLSPVKDHDVDYLTDLLNRLALVEGEDYTYSSPRGTRSQHLFNVIAPRYVDYFRAQYQHKYKQHESASNHVESDIEKQDAESIKSAKWLWEWCWQLSKDQCRCIIAGLRFADGSEAGNQNIIYTSSARFRDEILRLCLHAGYSARFKSMYLKGETRGIDKLSGKPFIATQDAWSVDYAKKNTIRPVLKSHSDIKKIAYRGRTWCVTVPHGFITVRRAVANSDGVIIKASRPTIQGNCLKDALLPLQILEKLMAVVNGIEQARVTGVPIKWLLARGQGIKTFSNILRYKQDEEHVPSRSPKSNTAVTGGGAVEEPVRGFYKVPLASLDFASLYPSIMIAFNICYSTKESLHWARAINPATGKPNLDPKDYWIPHPRLVSGCNATSCIL